MRSGARRGGVVSRPENPHSLLGESIKDFAASLEEVSRKLATVDLPSDAGDERALGRAAGELTRAWAQLEAAQGELELEQHRLEELLEAERVRYHDLFEWAPDAYLVTDPRGKILEANRAAERLLGRPRAFLAGKPLITLLAEDEHEAFRLTLDRLPGLEVISDWELGVCLRDKSVFPAAVTVSCMRDRSGQVASLRWLLRDVTERKRMEDEVLSANLELERRVRERTAALEEAVHDREEALGRLEAVLDQIPAGIVIADASSREVVTANDQAERLMRNIVRDDSRLESWLSHGTHPDGTSFRAEDRPIMRALESGETVTGEQIEFHRLDGTSGIFELSAAPVLNRDGEVVAAVAAYWDVTERERRARAEREFVTNAAHELRTPLAALASAVEVLQGGAKESAQDRDRFLAHVEQQCNRLQRLVRALLVLARAQTGQEGAEAEPIEVRELLEAVAAEGPPGRVRVDVRCPPRTGVLANRDLAEQALLNLISNSVKYAPEGEIVLTCGERNGFVSLEVIDSGPGIAPDDRARALERFYRGPENRAADGFGLGLSIVSQVADALHGKLEIEAGEGGGVKARLLLPPAS